MKKWLKRIGISLAILYLLCGGILYFAQEALIFHPRPRAENYSYGNYAEEWIDAPDGSQLHALHLRAAPGKTAERVIFYLHGNVGDNGRGVYQTKALQRLGYDLFLLDYPTFGKSQGDLADESDLTEDIQAAYDRLATEYGEKNIILLGYSLGSGPASYLLAENEPRGGVLIAPYESLTAMKDRWFWMFPDFLLKYELDNASRLAAATAPVLILHGTEDELIPFAMAERLRALAPERIELLPLRGTGHRGAIFREEVQRAVARLASE